MTDKLRDNIAIIPAKGLDRSKWDACVAVSAGGLIYSLSWVQDILAEDWYGLVVNDYEAVMALPVKRRLGLTMVYMPPFIQRLGIVGVRQDHVSIEVAEQVLKRFSLVHYNTMGKLFNKGVVKQRTDLALSLAAPYTDIANSYTPICKKNLRQATARGCNLAQDITIGDVVRLYKEVYGVRSGYSEHHFDRLERLVHIAMERESCHLAGVRTSDGELVYAGLLLDDGKRLYYLLGAPTPEGRNRRATYFFIDAMIARFAGSGRIFDFEGSDIPDVARFYQSFSPQTEHYFETYINQYPFPLNKVIDIKLSPRL